MKSKSKFKGLKVLIHDTYQPCKFRDERLLDELDNYHKEIEPVFYRDGEYLLDGKCWFEVRGRAFRKRKQDFLFELRQCEMLDVDINTVKKLIELQRIAPSILSKEQCDLIGDYKHFLGFRHNKRLSRKRIKEMKEKIKNRTM